jgi:hypothetical protein
VTLDALYGVSVIFIVASTTGRTHRWRTARVVVLYTS